MPQGPQTHTYPIPLPDFDPLAARPDQLALYGLPARPDPRLEQELFLFWAQLLGPPTTFIVPQFSRPGSSNLEVQSNLDAGRAMLRTGPPHRRFLSHQNSKNWSGVYITPSPRPNRFVQMTGGWTVPQPAVPGVPPSGARPASQEYRSSTWIGFDGKRSRYPNASLPQIGTHQFVTDTNGQEVVDTHAWIQWWVKDRQGYDEPLKITNFPVASGDKILSCMTIQVPGDVVFNIKNLTTGLFAAFIVIAPAGIQPIGSTAEWVHERQTMQRSKKLYPLPHCSDVNFNFCIARSTPLIGAQTNLQRLDNARLIRMYEQFDNPNRIAFVSLAKKTSSTSARVFYREAGSAIV